jgi:hypothetical protein
MKILMLESFSQEERAVSYISRAGNLENEEKGRDLLKRPRPAVGH